MSAEIAEVNGKQSYVGVEPAWHGLGTVLNRPFTAKEAIEYAGLDFEVEQAPIECKIEINGKEQIIEIPDRVANYRTDTGDYLGTVGKIYSPLQNRDAFSFFDNLVADGEAIYHTAGALGKGEKIWLLAKLPYQLTIGKDDLIDNYILVHNGHDGKTSITACVTPVRVVCQNTLNASLKNCSNKIAIRHTINATEKLQEAHKLMGITTEYVKQFEEVLEFMSHKKLNTKDVEFFLDSVYPINPENEARTAAVKIREGILNAFENGIGQYMITTKGTAYGLYNGFTYFTDHDKEFKTDETKLKSIWFHGTATKRQLAFDTLLEMSIQ